jgi:hypothetical protein
VLPKLAAPAMNAFLATAIPPAVVKVPPFVELVASVVFEILRPPGNKTEPREDEVEAVASVVVIFGVVKVLLENVKLAGLCIDVVPFPKSIELAVNVVLPVPPNGTVTVLAFHVPEVTFPPTERSVPIKAFFATARPPAEVIVPPFVALVASVVFEIPTPPAMVKEPVVLEVEAVVSSKITEPFVAFVVDLSVKLLLEAVPPVVT